MGFKTESSGTIAEGAHELFYSDGIGGLTHIQELSYQESAIYFRGFPTPSSWTFTVSSELAGYSGYQGTQSAGVGGLADGSSGSGVSDWASATAAGDHIITADFGDIVNVTSIHLRTRFFGEAAYINGAALESSNDGASWSTVIASISGVGDQDTTLSVNVNCRYLRLRRNDGQYLILGDFWFE